MGDTGADQLEWGNWPKNTRPDQQCEKYQIPSSVQFMSINLSAVLLGFVLIFGFYFLASSFFLVPLLFLLLALYPALFPLSTFITLRYRVSEVLADF